LDNECKGSRNKIKETCKIIEDQKVQCSAFHPESNGGLEQTHRVLAELPEALPKGRTKRFPTRPCKRAGLEKLSPQNIGPYNVTAANGVSATIKMGPNTQQEHVNRLKLFY
jgi:hypothetical protein